MIDVIEEQNTPIKNFIIPGETKLSSWAHLCRTQTRKVERLLVELCDSKTKLYGLKKGQEFELVEYNIPNNILLFINRLSDFFFVLARFLPVVEDIILSHKDL
jgi:cob(I)alamin adenosyltransferase